MGKIQREKTTKLKRNRDGEMIMKARPSKGKNNQNRILILGKILGMIQRKTIMKSMKNRQKAMMKKYRPYEVLSQSVEPVMLATEQRQEMVKLVRSQSMETVMLATEQQQESFRMLLEILSRLPVKSLLRFMCKNKHWKTLISSHPFRKMHREKHTSSPPLPIACYNTSDSLFEYNIPMTYLITFDCERRFIEKITVPIPIECFGMPAPPYQSKLLYFLCPKLMKFYLYNPSTRQYFLLTNPSSFSSPNLDLRFSAYGYIPSKDEYIMVHLVKLSNGNLYCEVLNILISEDNFKLQYNQWRSSPEVTIMIQFVTGPTAFVGGAFYWQVVDNPKNPKDGFILSFDVEADSFSTINYPPGVLRNDASLLEINNDLYLVVCPEGPAILVMWKWSSDNKLWSPDWKFDLEKLFGFMGGAPYHYRRDWFRSELFIYTLKYLKGYEDQPPDDQVSIEMGDLHFPEGVEKVPISTEAAVHSNLFTL